MHGLRCERDGGCDDSYLSATLVSLSHIGPSQRDGNGKLLGQRRYHRGPTITHSIPARDLWLSATGLRSAAFSRGDRAEIHALRPPITGPQKRSSSQQDAGEEADTKHQIRETQKPILLHGEKLP